MPRRAALTVGSTTIASSGLVTTALRTPSGSGKSSASRQGGKSDAISREPVITAPLRINREAGRRGEKRKIDWALTENSPGKKAIPQKSPRLPASLLIPPRAKGGGSAVGKSDFVIANSVNVAFRDGAALDALAVVLDAVRRAHVDHVVLAV